MVAYRIAGGRLADDELLALLVATGDSEGDPPAKPPPDLRASAAAGTTKHEGRA